MKDFLMETAKAAVGAAIVSAATIIGFGVGTKIMNDIPAKDTLNSTKEKIKNKFKRKEKVED